jgi:murein DD-endopeptidase MepM/ murein hydrolase activator NlpD
MRSRVGSSIPNRFLFFVLAALFLGAGCSTSRKPKRLGGTPREAREAWQKDNLIFLWPVERPQIMNFYGWRGKRRMHDGIDIVAKTGDKILASEAGRVVHAQWIRGYGRTVILSHGGGWYSLYAHLSKIHVRAGISVGQREVLGLAGRSGNASGPHLHFEIRKNADPLDPMLFLPK